MSNGPTVSTKEIAFSLADPRHLLAGVRLEHDLDLPGHCVDFRYDEPTGSWTLALPRPPVRRLEYKLVLRHPLTSGAELGSVPLTAITARGVDKLYSKLQVGTHVAKRQRQANICILRMARAWDAVRRLCRASRP